MPRKTNDQLRKIALEIAQLLVNKDMDTDEACCCCLIAASATIRTTSTISEADKQRLHEMLVQVQNEVWREPPLPMDGWHRNFN